MDVPGTKMLVTDFDNLINNYMPPKPSCKDCFDQNAARLSVSGRYRDEGLANGRYFGKDKKYFITQPINKNIIYVKRYTIKARNAANRALLLNDSTKPALKHAKSNSSNLKQAIGLLNQVK
jgi:hypothetical protein